MRYAFHWLRSLLFTTQMYLAMIVLALVFALPALVWRGASFFWMQSFCRWTRFTAAILIGLRTEVRGEVPTGAYIVASKHQAFLDSITLLSVLDAARFIMKKELTWIPVIGWHAVRMGCIPVDRGKRGKAISKMMADVKSGQAKPGQLIIYPQGTRVPPGETLPYKMGTALLYSQLGQDCIPVATNVGVFWPRKGLAYKPGLAVIEFLPAIKPGLSNAAFMAELESRIESASNRLMAEAGFTPK
ncbi:MAG: 1-acyl-sn-glycerol-3-phosphate acyltransferase [Rhodoferax sp.]|nr:1-acyl-sn-glycerol-3-phosphate acyltransferase [Pseudorhodobacter sp.]